MMNITMSAANQRPHVRQPVLRSSVREIDPAGAYRSF
jgi:hypothetical protein